MSHFFYAVDRCPTLAVQDVFPRNVQNGSVSLEATERQAWFRMLHLGNHKHPTGKRLSSWPLITGDAQCSILASAGADISKRDTVFGFECSNACLSRNALCAHENMH